MRRRNTTMLTAAMSLMVVCSPLHDAALASESQSQFFTGYAGDLPGDKTQRAGTYFEEPAVRTLIAQLDRGPLSKAQVARALAHTKVMADDLLRVKLIREERGMFYLGFAYYTAADMHLIYAASSKHVPQLVRAYLDHAPEFEALLAKYPAKSVSAGDLNYALISGISLNWDGLRRTLKNGLRQPILVSGSGWKYSFFAEEDAPDISRKSYFWGSSSVPIGPRDFPIKPAQVKFWMSSFGDPFSDPRFNFPDLMFLPQEAMPENLQAATKAVGLQDESLFGNEFKQILGTRAGEACGNILFALHDRPLSEGALAKKFPEVPRAQLHAMLHLLAEIRAVRVNKSGAYELLSPVFAEADARLVGDVLALSGKILDTWFEANGADMRRELAGLSAIKQGVPYEGLYTQIWHEIFGLATRELAAAKFTSDPYASDNPAKGSRAIMFRPSAYTPDF